MANSVAELALLAWPLVVVAIFRALPVPQAVAVSIVAGYLLLPLKTSFNLPLLPTYNKDLAASLPALVMAVLMSRPAGPRAAAASAATPALDGWLPKALLPRLCLLALLASPFVTAMLNGDRLVYGRLVLPGLTPYDAASTTLAAAVILLPFLLARKYLAQPKHHTMLLGLLCLAGLVYSLPTLFEVRMSPQLNYWIYGFGPDWLMTRRGDGFRPVVFLGHGLRLGILICVCLLATLGYARTRPPAERLMLLGAALWLLMTLVFCKTLGALLIGVALAPLVLLLGVRLQLLAAALLAALVLTFPMTRSTGLFPTGTVIDTVSKVTSEQRVRSLNFRFINEDLALEKANERPLFGWGGWGRARAYTEDGREASRALDGSWIIIFGEGGWVRYFSQFGLLTLPIVLIAWRRRRYEVTIATSALCLVLAANLLDLLPNSGISPITWLLAGALVGRMEVKTAADAPAAEPQGRQPLPYRRQFPAPSAPEPAPRAPTASRTPAAPIRRERPALRRERSQTHFRRRS